MEHPSSSSDAGCGATVRALDMFNRRGSVIAVAMGDVMPHSNVSSTTSGASMISADLASTTNSEPDKDEKCIDGRLPYPRLCAFHDCVSLAAAWNLGMCPLWVESNVRPTGASQAQSPAEEDSGDGKSNELLASCPAFRNELGCEPIRHVALSRATKELVVDISEQESWQREHTAAEIGILEDVSNVYLGGRLCAARQPKNVIEPQDLGSYYFRHCFAGRQHTDYFGFDEEMGPMAVSMVKEIVERKGENPPQSTIFRIIIRISEYRPIRLAIPEEALPDTSSERSNRALLRELLEIAYPKIPFGALRPSTHTQKVEEMLMKIDEQPIYTRYKVGVMLCAAGQCTEEQMYNNENSSPAFDEFLDFLGTRVRLKGFDMYKGGLDTRGDTTGTHSIYAEYQAHNIMFHVSTLLPYTPSNRQQLSRKRHIGNDMVTVIFQEPGALPFSPITVRSHFQHVFIIVRANKPCTDQVSYSVAVSRSKDVPSFGPPVPSGASFSKCADFHDWLLTKIINAENAVHRSKKFATMAARTRREALKDLAENHVGPHPNDGASRIASRLLGGSVKRKGEKTTPKKKTLATVRGALTWLVDVQDHSLNQRISCVLGVSVEAMVLLERPSGTVIFATPTHSIIGWANTEFGLRIYYDHGETLFLRCCSMDGNDEELAQLLERLEAVTKGDEAKEIILRRPSINIPWGFHFHDEGVVTEVDMYQIAWKAGLRQGSRIVEIENQSVVTLGTEDMSVLIRERECIRLLLVSPAPDGSPRRGCEDPNCPAVKGTDLMLTPDAFAKQPVTYQEMFRMRNREYSQGSSSGSFDERASIRDSFSYSKNNLCSTNSGPPMNRPSRSTNHSSSVHEHMCSLLNPPKPLNRALSDELFRLSFTSTSDSQFQPLSARDATQTDLVSCQQLLSQLIEEKKQLESTVQQLNEQLALERRKHEETRRALDDIRNKYEK